MGKLFGTDGVRGKANVELTAEIAMLLGRVATFYFGEKAERPLILIGRDTRISGQMLATALSAGICSAGGRVIDLGVVPTPAVAYITKKIGAQAGVMISASHNPFYDNGIKFFADDGYKLTDEVEEKLEKVLLENISELKLPTDEKIGTIMHQPNLLEDYIDFLVTTMDTDLKGLKVVLDCSNGASSEVAPRVLKRLGADVKVIFHEPDGININDGCGSTHLDALRKAVREMKADIGIANDGDADRCLAVDENGSIINGDRILLACAESLLQRGKLKNNTLVTTVMSNLGLHEAFRQMGGRLEVTGVGDRYVLENMLDNGYALGGEQSGHVIFSEHSTTGDGVLTAIQLLAVLKKSGRKASEITSLMFDYPQLLVNVRVKNKTGWEENQAIKNVVYRAEREIGGDGRILVRASGTEPLIRVMGEGKDEKVLHELVQMIVAVVKQELGEE